MGVREGSALAALRAQVARIEGRSRRGRSVLPFGIREVDGRLPGGGLALGALHEVAGGGNGAIDGAAAALFAGGVAACRGAWIRGVGATTPTLSGVRRCGRSSGVRAPACG